MSSWCGEKELHCSPKLDIRYIDKEDGEFSVHFTPRLLKTYKVSPPLCCAVDPSQQPSRSADKENVLHRSYQGRVGEGQLLPYFSLMDLQETLVGPRLP